MKRLVIDIFRRISFIIGIAFIACFIVGVIVVHLGTHKWRSPDRPIIALVIGLSSLIIFYLLSIIGESY